MKKVSIFLDIENNININSEVLLQYNPGLGGTEYQLLILSKLLHSRENNLEVRLIGGHNPFNDLQNIDFTPEDCLEKAIIIADQRHDDYLIFCHRKTIVFDNRLEYNCKYTKLVVWSHNLMERVELDYYANHDSIWKLVFVGREHRDYYRDHIVFEKSEYIYNCFNTTAPEGLVPNSDRKHAVVFMGAIVPAKGFHILAKVWPEVLKKIPDAELYVIGSGKLYDKEIKMGPFDLAEENYEDQIMRHLAPDGHILSGVHLLGILQDKSAVLSQTKVGWISGASETFCLSGTEMQTYGIKTVIRKCAGALDTTKFGLIYRSNAKLAKHLVRMLNETDNSGYLDTIAYFQEHFSYDVFCRRWEQLLINGKIQKEEMVNPFYRLKFIKEQLRHLKKLIIPLQNLHLVENHIHFIERKLHITF